MHLFFPYSNPPRQRREVIGLILERGGDVDCQNKHGETALHQATWRGRLQNVKVLLEMHAGVDITNRSDTYSAQVIEWFVLSLDLSYGETGLHFAARTGQIEIAKLLLNAGADPQVRGDYGDCVNVALSSNQKEMLDLLTSKYRAVS